MDFLLKIAWTLFLFVHKSVHSIILHFELIPINQIMIANHRDLPVMLLFSRSGRKTCLWEENIPTQNVPQNLADVILNPSIPGNVLKIQKEKRVVILKPNMIVQGRY